MSVYILHNIHKCQIVMCIVNVTQKMSFYIIICKSVICC